LFDFFFRFVFGAEASVSGEIMVDASSDVDVVSGSESGLAAQEGLDSFALDISQFSIPGSNNAFNKSSLSVYRLYVNDL
jgi:hypothetical protein